MGAIGARVGKDITVDAVIDLGQLAPSDVTVELYYGRLDDDGQLTDGNAVPMQEVGKDGERKIRYSVNMPTARSGMTGYTVRVMPNHENLSDPRDMALIKWA